MSMEDEAVGTRLVEARATVVAVEAGAVTVAPQRVSGCASCGATGHCGTEALGKIIGRQDSRLRLRSDLDLAVGEPVVLTVPEGGLLLAAALAYLLPLAGLFSATLFVAIAGGSEAETMLAAVLGLVAGLLAARKAATSPSLVARFLAVRIRR